MLRIRLFPKSTWGPGVHVFSPGFLTQHCLSRAAACNSQNPRTILYFFLQPPLGANRLLGWLALSFTPGPSWYGMQTEGLENPGISNAGWDASLQEGPSLLFFNKIPFCLSNHILMKGLPMLLSSIQYKGSEQGSDIITLTSCLIQYNYYIKSRPFRRVKFSYLGSNGLQVIFTIYQLQKYYDWGMVLAFPLCFCCIRAKREVEASVQSCTPCYYHICLLFSINSCVLCFSAFVFLSSLSGRLMVRTVLLLGLALLD